MKERKTGRESILPAPVVNGRNPNSSLDKEWDAVYDLDAADPMGLDNYETATRNPAASPDPSERSRIVHASSDGEKGPSQLSEKGSSKNHKRTIPVKGPFEVNEMNIV